MLKVLAMLTVLASVFNLEASAGPAYPFCLAGCIAACGATGPAAPPCIAACAAACAGTCFEDGTVMEACNPAVDGIVRLVNVEELQPGDHVLSMDSESNPVCTEVVQNIR